MADKKQHLFNVVELRKNKKEEYALMMTDEEMTAYLKGKRDMNGYIPGLGGDKCYSIIAFYAIH